MHIKTYHHNLSGKSAGLNIPLIALSVAIVLLLTPSALIGKKERIDVNQSPFLYTIEHFHQPITFSLSSDDGNIRVIGGPTERIVVHISDLESDFEPENGSAMLICNSETGTISMSMHGDLVESDVYVIVPETASVSLNSYDGDLVVENLLGDVHCKASDGNITFSNTSGSISCESLDGNIYIQQDALSNNPISASSIDGNITLQIANQTNAEILASAIDGDINFNIKGSINTIAPDKGAETRNKWNQIMGNSRQLIRIGKGEPTQFAQLHTIDGNILISNIPRPPAPPPPPAPEAP